MHDSPKTLISLQKAVFLKVDQDGDEMIIDIMVSGSLRHDQVIEDALEAYSQHTGTVRVARREDLIWLKSQRKSPIDQADIEILKNEKKKTIDELLKKLSDLYEFNREITRFKLLSKVTPTDQSLQRTAASRRHSSPRSGKTS